MARRTNTWYPAYVEWAEQLSLGGPLAVVLGAGILALARAYSAKDEALAKAQQARIDDLKEIITRSEED